MKEILGMSLHDCTLSDINIHWKEKKVTLCINTLSSKSQPSTIKIIAFTNISEIQIPRKDEWGPSNSIYEVKYEDGQYLIQMQSGDEIKITCEKVSL